MSDPRLTTLLHQLELAYRRRSWHGPNLRGSLRGVAEEEATFRPRPERHNVWELVVHCAYWKYRVCRLLRPDDHAAFSIAGSDWFPRPEGSGGRGWREDLELLDRWHERLRTAVGSLDPARLDSPSGRGEFTVLEVVSGAAAHDLYHAGQIRLLRRMYGDAAAPA